MSRNEVDMMMIPVAYAKVSQRRNQYGEWTVTSYSKNGNRIGTYYTDDKSDADGTCVEINRRAADYCSSL